MVASAAGHLRVPQAQPRRQDENVAHPPTQNAIIVTEITTKTQAATTDMRSRRCCTATIETVRTLFGDV
jgi:hypothetical protein